MAKRPADLPGSVPRRRPQQPADETVLATPVADRLMLFIGLPLLGVVAALFLPPLARWALDLGTGLPVRPVFWAVGAIDQWWKILVAVVLGLLLGLSGAAAAYQRSTRATLTDTQLRLEVDDWTRTIARGDVAAVFLDQRKLVVLDAGSRQLFSASLASPKDTIADAFQAHGYPWRDADPYADLYRRWEPDTPDLSTEVNAVLAAREAALKKKATTEVRNLRDAIQKLDYAVREEGSKQFWRPLVRS